MTEQELIQEYLNGKSISTLAKETEYTYCGIQKILRNNLITIRGGRKKKELSDELLKLFKIDIEINNFTDDELKEKYKMSIETLKRIRDENNIIKPNNNKINRKIKSNYFSAIDSPEKAYWIGFLFTDGSVNESTRTDNSSARIRFQLQEADKEILEKFKEDLGLDCKLIYDKRENKHCYSVEFVDNQIFNDLAKFGIVPQKTYKTKHLMYDSIPEEYLPAYILGLFDGDGCLTYSADCSTDVTFGFTTYYESVVKDFLELIDNLILHKTEHNTNFFTLAWHTQWRGRLLVLQILDYLYGHCPRHLKRKYDKYLVLKESLN